MSTDFHSLFLLNEGLIMINLGEKLLRIRKEKGVSSSKLEILSGVNQSTISRIETNTQSPTIDTLLKLCEALGISIIDLFDSENLPADMYNLINTAKQLTPTQRQKVTEMLQSFSNKI
jgi:transcriptional regulator with XRE-family HTH domain